MAYLVTAPAQDIWVKIGGALSANKNATDYPDDISKRSAAILTNAKIFALRRLRPDADGHERRVLEGHRRVHQGPEPARLDPVEPGHRPGDRLRGAVAVASCSAGAAGDGRSHRPHPLGRPVDGSASGHGASSWWSASRPS